MIPKELIKKIKRIEIKTRSLVNTLFSGEYKSVFKGRGMEFSDVREYTYGDDMRFIDWNVTARMQSPYVKKFMEERELTVIFLVDASASGTFGSVERMKGEIGVEICSVLAFSAIKNNDRVGLIIFTDKVEKYIAPKKGRKNVLRVIRELLYFKPENRGTNLSVALDFLGKVTKRSAVVFLVSDFLSGGYDSSLRIAGRRHDLIAIDITDPREEELPEVGFLELEDAETGETLLVDTYSSGLRNNFKKLTEKIKMEKKQIFMSNRIDEIAVRTDEPYIEPLVKFFKGRTGVR
ncbi:MAG TPA: DUF58 domain-containing protein [Candidatus Eremiobacteraeota bacterium]|nr:DUF58 domain-containing protein [Candidatus Eremiobacteraeota bacterium]